MHLDNCLGKSGTDRKVKNHWKVDLNTQRWLRNIFFSFETDIFPSR